MKNQASSDGFTLAELLVALALISLIAAYAVSTLSTLGNVRRVEQRIDENAVHASALRSMKITLSDARAVFDADANSQLRLAFDGQTDTLSFVSTLDDHLERGGLFRMRYARDAATQKLILSYAVRRAQDRTFNETAILLDSISTLKFRYFGRQGNSAATWYDTWEQQDELPKLIEVSINEKKPPLLINIAAAQ